MRCWFVCGGARRRPAAVQVTMSCRDFSIASGERSLGSIPARSAVVTRPVKRYLHCCWHGLTIATFAINSILDLYECSEARHHIWIAHCSDSDTVVVCWRSHAQLLNMCTPLLRFLSRQILLRYVVVRKFARTVTAPERFLAEKQNKGETK